MSRCRPVVPRGYPAGSARRRTSRCRISRRRLRIRSARRERGGGANYGPLSYSPRTGLLYVNAIDQPDQRRDARRKATSPPSIPTTGELVWQQMFEGYGQAGSVVTAGDLVFVGTGSNIAGYFFAYDAKTGRAAVEVQHRRRRVLVARRSTW